MHMIACMPKAPQQKVVFVCVCVFEGGCLFILRLVIEQIQQQQTNIIRDTNLQSKQKIKLMITVEKFVLEL